MAKSKAKYPEIEDLKQDIDSLKSNVVELTKHIRKDSTEEVADVRDMAIERFESLKATGEEQLQNVETRVKEKPMQSVAIAFAAGIFASMIMGRR